MATHRQAGLVSLSRNQHLLLIVERHWQQWQIQDIIEGSLNQLAELAQHVAVALAIADDSVLHWQEEFPAHLSQAAIRRYLKNSKAEWFNETGHQLTLEPLPCLTPGLQQLRCWLLTDTSYRTICQTYLDHGFDIRALEPLCCLDARPMPAYLDPQHLLGSVNSVAQPQALLACKLACRHHWA